MSRADLGHRRVQRLRDRVGITEERREQQSPTGVSQLIEWRNDGFGPTLVGVAGIIGPLGVDRQQMVEVRRRLGPRLICGFGHVSPAQL